MQETNGENYWSFCMSRKENTVNHIKAFESYLSNNGKADKTIESYTGDVKGYLRYISDKNITFNGNLNRFSINSYKNYLLDNNYEPTTINKKLNSLQAFNIYLIDAKTMTDMVINLGRDRIKIAKGSEKQVETYSDAIIEALMFHLESNPKSLRDKVMMQLLLYTGVRVSELVNIKIRDIDFLTHQLKVIGKGGKYREIPLKQDVVGSVKEYLLERRHNPFYKSEQLLLGQRGPLGRDAVNRVLARITKEAKLPKKLKPHTCRHSFCTNLIKKGVPLTTVAKLAGHASIETTSRFYIGCSRQEKMDAVNLL